jgi:hypothetical protein
VQDVLVKLGVAVHNRVADFVVRLAASHDEIAVVDPRLHARAGDDGVRRGAAELPGPEQNPGTHEQCESNSADQKPYARRSPHGRSCREGRDGEAYAVPTALDYCVATTVRFVAAATVA